jgi:hypothetical protein
VVKEIRMAMSHTICKALHEAGVISDPLERVGRVVIDLKPGEPGRMYIERLLDDTFVAVVLAGGLKVEVSS